MSGLRSICVAASISTLSMSCARRARVEPTEVQTHRVWALVSGSRLTRELERDPPTSVEAEVRSRCVDNEVFVFDDRGGLGELERRCVGEQLCVDTSATTATCAEIKSTCDNGVVEAGERCDRAELGAETCESLGYPGGGRLTCIAEYCEYDLTDCRAGRADLVVAFD